MRCRTIIKFRNSDDPNDLGFGRGIVQLLEGMEELGSINRATARLAPDGRGARADPAVSRGA